MLIGLKCGMEVKLWQVNLVGTLVECCGRRCVSVVIVVCWLEWGHSKVCLIGRSVAFAKQDDVRR